MCVLRRLPHTLDTWWRLIGPPSPILGLWVLGSGLGFRLPLIAIACPGAGRSLFVLAPSYFPSRWPGIYAANNAVSAQRWINKHWSWKLASIFTQLIFLIRRALFSLLIALCDQADDRKSKGELRFLQNLICLCSPARCWYLLIKHETLFTACPGQISWLLNEPNHVNFLRKYWVGAARAENLARSWPGIGIGTGLAIGLRGNPRRVPVRFHT